jgi:hypothetical protein
VLVAGSLQPPDSTTAADAQLFTVQGSSLGAT